MHIIKSEVDVFQTLTSLWAGKLRNWFWFPGRVREISLSTVSRPALECTQLPFQRAPGTLSPGIKGRKVVLLTTHRNYLPRSRKVDLYTRVPSTHSRRHAWLKLKTEALATPFYSEKSLYHTQRKTALLCLIMQCGHGSKTSAFSTVTEDGGRVQSTPASKPQAKIPLYTFNGRSGMMYLATHQRLLHGEAFLAFCSPFLHED